MIIRSLLLLFASSYATIAAFTFDAKNHDEVTLIKNRLPTMQQTISRFMSSRRTLLAENIPNIGVAVSGGGWVAAIAELGFLQGLQDIGLLDGVASIATSSGSTWMLSTWLNLYAQDDSVSLADVEMFLRGKLAQGFSFNHATVNDWKETFKLRNRNKLPFDVTCIWGEALTQQFLDLAKDRSTVHDLSSTADILRAGTLPLPLFTSVVKPETTKTEVFFSALSWFLSLVKTVADKPKKQFAWIDYSPFETRITGSEAMRIATKDLGVSWNYLLGTWGSAYAGDAMENFDLINEMLVGTWGVSLTSFASPFYNCFSLTNPFSPTMPNFMYGSNNAFGKQRNLRPVDSGIDLKVPFPPLFDRSTEIIIVCDVSSDRNYKNGSHSVEQAAQYARQHGFIFPQISNVTELENNQVVFIHDRDNSTAPMIIYFKSMLTEDMTPTNTEPKFTRIHDEMRNLVGVNRDLFAQAINKWQNTQKQGEKTRSRSATKSFKRARAA